MFISVYSGVFYLLNSSLSIILSINSPILVIIGTTSAFPMARPAAICENPYK